MKALLSPSHVAEGASRRHAGLFVSHALLLEAVGSRSARVTAGTGAPYRWPPAKCGGAAWCGWPVADCGVDTPDWSAPRVNPGVTPGVTPQARATIVMPDPRLQVRVISTSGVR